ncbi:MAG: hypothetical protein Hyperionvirus20_40 [Hyperionvirus sp.]|uniref:Uncharacterized protein n=1 Tax=Hyperionvirus sp. TaxID=2487770 RepID=A0A3G5AAX0_9VIRU|nr:MAG: hypothetical protein Hyperionvirus20_40 [Hyperionvirus sp.]
MNSGLNLNLKLTMAVSPVRSASFPSLSSLEKRRRAVWQMGPAWMKGE